MVLKEMFVCCKSNSSVGYSTVFRKYIIAVTVVWSVDYKRYYEITKEEYFSAKESEKAAKALTARYKDLGICQSMLFSERISENSIKQLDLMREYYESSDKDKRGTKQKQKQKAEETTKSSSKTKKQRASRATITSKSKALAKVKDKETQRDLAEIGFAV